MPFRQARLAWADPDLGLNGGTALVVCQAAHVSVSRKCPERGGIKAAEMAGRFRLEEGRGLGQGGLGRVPHSPGSAAGNAGHVVTSGERRKVWTSYHLQCLGFVTYWRA